MTNKKQTSELDKEELEDEEEVAIVAPVATSERLSALKAKMGEALQKGDITLLQQLAAEHKKLEKSAEEEIEKERLAALISIVAEVRDTVIIKPIKQLIELGKLDKADGLWVKWDFSELFELGINPQVSLIKPKKAAVKGATGTGAHKGTRVDLSPEDLLVKTEGLIFGDGTNGTIKAPAAVSGMTPRDAYASDKDGNFRYFKVRVPILKHLGLM